MKKLFNNKEQMPDDMISGFVAAYPDVVRRGVNPRVVQRTRLRTKEAVSYTHLTLPTICSV